MIAVLFEVIPTDDGKNEYLDLASELRPLLADIDGFISIERFQSLSNPNKLLSLSYWQDETSVQVWRDNALHQQAQCKGKSYLFKDFTIKIASVTREYSMNSTTKQVKL